jgi:hypothetical protein
MRKVDINVGGVSIGESPTWAYPAGYSLGIFSVPVYSCSVRGKDNNGNSIHERFSVLRFGVKCDDGKTAKVVGLADFQSHVIKAWLGSYTVHSAASQENGAWQVKDNFLIHDGPDHPGELFATVGCIEIMGHKGFSRFNDLLLKLTGPSAGSRAKQLAEIGRSGCLVMTYEKASRPPLKRR